MDLSATEHKGRASERADILSAHSLAPIDAREKLARVHLLRRRRIILLLLLLLQRRKQRLFSSEPSALYYGARVPKGRLRE